MKSFQIRKEFCSCLLVWQVLAAMNTSVLSVVDLFAASTSHIIWQHKSSSGILRLLV